MTSGANMYFCVAKGYLLSANGVYQHYFLWFRNEKGCISYLLYPPKKYFAFSTFNRYRRILPSLSFIPQRMASATSNVSMITLPAKSDIYKGMTVDAKELSLSVTDFENALKGSLKKWITSGIRGVWFKVNLGNSSYIPILVKHGFSFHHAKSSYAMLTRWLPADQPNLLPQYPHTHIGVAGMVINEKRQVLTIQEKYHRPPHLYWKLPGGYSNPGEDFADTARREVFEETGIETEFLSVISLRHHHQHIFNCSDIYVVCHLRPVTDTIQTSKDEIAECQWMDDCKKPGKKNPAWAGFIIPPLGAQSTIVDQIETYRNHPQVTSFNKYVMNAFLESEQLKCAIKSTSVISFNKESFHKVYSVQSVESCDSAS